MEAYEMVEPGADYEEMKLMNFGIDPFGGDDCSEVCDDHIPTTVPSAAPVPEPPDPDYKVQEEQYELVDPDADYEEMKIMNFGIDPFGEDDNEIAAPHSEIQAVELQSYEMVDPNADYEEMKIMNFGVDPFGENDDEDTVSTPTTSAISSEGKKEGNDWSTYGVVVPGSEVLKTSDEVPSTEVYGVVGVYDEKSEKSYVLDEDGYNRTKSIPRQGRTKVNLMDSINSALASEPGPSPDDTTLERSVSIDPAFIKDPAKIVAKEDPDLMGFGMNRRLSKDIAFYDEQFAIQTLARRKKKGDMNPYNMALRHGDVTGFYELASQLREKLLEDVRTIPKEAIYQVYKKDKMRAFSGQDLIDWLLAWKHAHGRPEGVTIGMSLLMHGRIVSVKKQVVFRDSKDLYRFRLDQTDCPIKIWDPIANILHKGESTEYNIAAREAVLIWGGAHHHDTLVHSRMVGRKVYKDVFIGKAFVDWLAISGKAPTRSDAIQLARKLASGGFIIDVSTKRGAGNFVDEYILYKFYYDTLQWDDDYFSGFVKAPQGQAYMGHIDYTLYDWIKYKPKKFSNDEKKGESKLQRGLPGTVSRQTAIRRSGKLRGKSASSLRASVLNAISEGKSTGDDEGVEFGFSNISESTEDTESTTSSQKNAYRNNGEGENAVPVYTGEDDLPCYEHPPNYDDPDDMHLEERFRIMNSSGSESFRVKKADKTKLITDKESDLIEQKLAELSVSNLDNYDF